MRSLYVLLAAVIFITSCSKDEITSSRHSLSNVSIGFINAANSPQESWVHILGGKAAVEFNFVNLNGSSSTGIKDSVDLKYLSSYTKALSKGTYDVRLTAQNSALADTFMRFIAEKKGLNIHQDGKIPLDATTADGLITINKFYVEDETVPEFTPYAADSVSYKLKFHKGYYYLYVKGGTSGRLKFDESGTNAPNSKELVVEASQHYNLIVSDPAVTRLNFTNTKIKNIF